MMALHGELQKMQSGVEWMVFWAGVTVVYVLFGIMVDKNYRHELSPNAEMIPVDHLLLVGMWPFWMVVLWLMRLYKGGRG